MTARFGVIGQPVAHSRSPEIHQQFAQSLGLEIEYLKLESTTENFEKDLRDFADAGGQGVNVTVPFKQAASALASSRSKDVELAAAANTLSFSAGAITADNTDGVGLIRDLQRLGVGLSGMRILLIGAGGAARGVLGPLLCRSPVELVWSSRSPWVVQELASQFESLGKLRPCTNLALKGDRFDLVINATSAGHRGLAPVLPDELFADNAIAYDLSYGDAATPFLDWVAGQSIAQRHDGLGMLVEQAAAAFEIWHGLRPEAEPVIQWLREREAS